MPTLAPLRLAPQPRTYSIDPPGTCRVCGGGVPAVQVEITGVATAGKREGGMVPLNVDVAAIVTATECGHVLNDNGGGDD